MILDNGRQKHEKPITVSVVVFGSANAVSAIPKATCQGHHAALGIRGIIRLKQT